jgi:SAM-dependent methyltransferase
MKYTGERQVSAELDGIRSDHLARYQYVTDRLSKDSVVIDVGCGIGYGSNIMAQNAASVYSIDIDEESIAYAKKNWSRKNIIFDNKDILRANLRDSISPVDVVTAFEVVEHVVCDEGIFSAARSILKPGGMLYISVPNEEVVPHTVLLNPHHIKHYHLDEISGLLTKNGFVVEEVSYQNDSGFTEREKEKKFIIISARSEASFDAPPVDMLKVVSDSNTFIIDRANEIRILQKKVRAMSFREGEIKNGVGRFVEEGGVSLLVEYYKAKEAHLKDLTIASDSSEELKLLRKENFSLSQNSKTMQELLQGKEKINERLSARLDLQSEALKRIKSLADSNTDKKVENINKQLTKAEQRSKRYKSQWLESQSRLTPSMGGLVRNRFFIPYVIKAIYNTITAKISRTD